MEYQDFRVAAVSAIEDAAMAADRFLLWPGLERVLWARYLQVGEELDARAVAAGIVRRLERAAAREQEWALAQYA